MKHNSRHSYAGRKFTQYINSGSCVTVPAGVPLDNGPIAMQRLWALSVKVPDSTASVSSPPSAGASRSLFVLSITIQLFELDTRFMTTSIHLLVSDDSVAHTPLMYSEKERARRIGQKGHVPSDCKVFPDESRRSGHLGFIKGCFSISLV